MGDVILIPAGRFHVTFCGFPRVNGSVPQGMGTFRLFHLAAEPSISVQKGSMGGFVQQTLAFKLPVDFHQGLTNLFQ